MTGKSRDLTPIEFDNAKAAMDDAQVALAEMAREKLPDGAKVDLKTKFEDEAGAEIYRASLSWPG